jgi:hypothetical protein
LNRLAAVDEDEDAEPLAAFANMGDLSPPGKNFGQKVKGVNVKHKLKLFPLVLIGAALFAPSIANAKCTFQYSECLDFFGNCPDCVDQVFVWNCSGSIVYTWEGCCGCT